VSRLRAVWKYFTWVRKQGYKRIGWGAAGWAELFLWPKRTILPWPRLKRTRCQHSGGRHDVCEVCLSRKVLHRWNWSWRCPRVNTTWGYACIRVWELDLKLNCINCHINGKPNISLSEELRLAKEQPLNIKERWHRPTLTARTEQNNISSAGKGGREQKVRLLYVSDRQKCQTTRGQEQKDVETGWSWISADVWGERTLRHLRRRERQTAAKASLF